MVLTSFAPCLVAASALLLAPSIAAANPTVNPTVQSTLRAKGTVNLIITLKAGVIDPLNTIRNKQFANRGQKITELVTELEAYATSSQQSINGLLASDAKKNNRYKTAESFWITNQLLVSGASAKLVEQLSQNADIAEIREEIILPPPQIKVVATNTTAIAKPAGTPEWGVSTVSAPSAWAGGFLGQNVVVGSIDTGVVASHVDLKPNWRSTFGWFDPTSRRVTAPYDDQGHGTHTVGTIVGLNGIGVAPGAKFIACRACTSNGCTESALLSCAQFMTCPTTPDRKIKDCSKAADLVNNSWGGGQGGTFFAGAIAAWQTAGIIPVFANGNSGSACGTANSPGDSGSVIAVGATDATDMLASFSSRGPSVGGLIKPDISAPGVNVRSAWNAGASAYASLSGTSMATPHVSGVIALMLSKNLGLTFDQVKTAISRSTDRSTIKPTGATCGGTGDAVYPNNQYGYGRVNALAAIQSV